MNFKSYSVYDQEDFFEVYNERRKRGNAPNELIEQPIIDELIGNVEEKSILDLGCGDGKYGIKLLKRGARYYHGIEGSKKMSDLAMANLKNDIPLERMGNYTANIEVGDIELVPFEKVKYDIVLSRLVLHYIEDLESLLTRIHKSLNEEGIFVFSVEHPIITSSYESYHLKVKRENWIVDNYFDCGERINQWIGKNVIKYHKTIETYWKLFKKTNLEVVEIRESKPQKVNFKDKEEFKRRNRIPLFLIFKLKKVNL